MNIKSPIIVAAAAALTLLQAVAVPILVGEGNTGANSPATTFAYAQGLVATYNGANNPDLPSLPVTPSFDVNSGYPRTATPSGPKDDISITVSSSFAYILFKWGGANKNPHEVQLWYVDAPGTYLFDAPTYTEKGKTKQNGLSHYDFFAARTPPQVPDGGSMLVLLGGSVTVLGFLRRKISA